MWKIVILLIIVIVFYKIKKTKPKYTCKSTIVSNVDEDELHEDKKEELPYKKKNYLLSKAEYNFYKVLNMAISENLYICPKVRLADIIYVSNTPNRQRYWNKIQSKHVDFLICKKDFLNPLLVIELDDSTHNREERITRDEFLNKALESAGLPIIRVKADAGYNPNELNLRINELLKKGSKGGELMEENKG